MSDIEVTSVHLKSVMFIRYYNMTGKAEDQLDAMMEKLRQQEKSINI